MDEKTYLSKIASIGLKTILVSLGISIILFIPFLPMGLVFTKGIILTLGAAIGLVLYFVDSISVGRFILPRGTTWKVFLMLVLVSAGTSFFVPNPLNSFLGSGFDTMTVSTLAIVFIYFFLINVWGNGINFTKYIFKTIMITGFVAVLFSTLQLVFNIVGKFPKAFISLGDSNLVGSFHDLAFLLGLFVIILTVSLGGNFWRGPMKVISTIAVVLSLVILFAINYTFLWYVIGISALALLIFELMPSSKNTNTSNELESNTVNLVSKKRRFSVITFLVVFCAFVGVTGASSISVFFSKPPMSFNVSEPRPNIMSTLTIIKHNYYYNPLTGGGLNRFNQIWEKGKHKILKGNLVGSQYWNASFDNGASIFLGFIATLGVFGAIVFVWLMSLFAKNIMNLFTKESLSKIRPRDLLIYGFTSVYAFFIIIFDTPNTVLFVASIAIFSMVAVRYYDAKGLKNKEYWFINDPRHSFFGILGTVIAIIATVFVTFVIMSSFYAGYLVNKAAIKPITNGGILESQSVLNRAISIHKLDDYARFAADAYLVGVNTILQDETQSQESILAGLNTELTNAATNAKLAISLDPKNYQNYVSLLKVQEVIFELGDTSGYEDAILNTEQILKLSPANVGIIYRQAKLAAMANNYTAAYDFTDKIISINKSFIDVYILRSQIALMEGNIQKALDFVDEGSSFNPNNAVLPYQKGLIYMDNKNYSSAVSSFELALRLAPRALDIYSSLAVAYERMGQKDSVIRVLNTAKQFVSNKDQVDALIEKVKNGGTLSSDSSALETQGNIEGTDPEEANSENR